jgi:prophage antirepressor-like protein
MEIVKAFQNDMKITIQGSYEEPLFRASDIGNVLEMSNIRASIQDFDNSEKRGVNTIDTIGRDQEVTFLTEKGLYKVLFRSRKPIAEKFQNWVCEVIKELRLKGTYNLQKQLEQKDQQREKVIIDNFEGKRIVYVGYADKEKNIVKPGITGRSKDERLNEHKHTYGKDFTYEYVYESMYHDEIERRLKKHQKLIKRQVTKEYKGQNRTELYQLDDEFTIGDLDLLIREIKKEVELEEVDKDKNTIINQLKLELYESRDIYENKIEKYKNEIEILTKQLAEKQLVKKQLVKRNLEEQGVNVCSINPEKYFQLFLRDFLKKNHDKEMITVEIDEMLKYYKEFVHSTEITDVANIYTDATFNRKLNKCPFMKNKRIDFAGSRKEGTRKRKTLRVIDIKLLKIFLM